MNTFIDFELDGKKIVFHKDSIVEIQLGKNRSAYKTVRSFTAEKFGQVVMHYNMLNVGNGYKKRLICRTLNEPILNRKITRI